MALSLPSDTTDGALCASRPAAHRTPTRLTWSPAQLVWPCAFALLASFWLLGAHGDFLIADWWFDAATGQWPLRHAWWTETLLHQGGRTLSAIAWLAVSLTALYLHRRRPNSPWRRPLIYLSLAVLLSASAVAVFKHTLVSDCPWDLERFGGKRPTLTVLDARPADLPAGHCFPAGQASAGYAWLSLYWALGALGASLSQRRRALLGVLGVGLLFGVAQQLRGAHFLSHDLWTATLCWSVATVLSPLAVRRERPTC